VELIENGFEKIATFQQGLPHGDYLAMALTSLIAMAFFVYLVSSLFGAAHSGWNVLTLLFVSAFGLVAAIVTAQAYGLLAGCFVAVSIWILSGILRRLIFGGDRGLFES